MTVIEPRSRVNSRDELMQVALTLFANDGFAATSLQHIADAAGYSKSSVLYHFASKEAVLDAALQPAIAALEQLVDQFEHSGVMSYGSPSQVEGFVDFLLTHRLQAALLLIQGPSLGDIPIIHSSNAMVQRLSDAICSASGTLTDQMRVSIGLAGTAFVLVANGVLFRQEITRPDEEVRTALIGVLTDLFRTER